MRAEDKATRERSRINIVCEDCDSLSIKVAIPQILTMPLLCGVGDATPSAGRWTHDLARHGNDVFEILIGKSPQ